MSYSIYRGPTTLQSPLYQEGAAGDVFKPGHIVAKSGDDLSLADAATVGILLIAKENGAGQGGTIDAEFAVGDYISAYKARQGLIFDVRVATGEVLVQGETLLERGANGRLTVLASGVAVAVAYETVTTTADDQLVTVEVL